MFSVQRLFKQRFQIFVFVALFLQGACDIGVYAQKADARRVFILQIAQEMRIDIRVAINGVQTCILKHFNILRLFVFVRNVVDRLRFLAVLCVLFRNFLTIERTDGTVFARKIFVDDDVFDLFIELLVLQASELDESRQIRPAGFIALPVVLIQFDQFVRNFFGDVFCDLLHLLIVLQEGAGYVERDIRAIDHTV